MIRDSLEALRREGYAPRSMLDVGAHVGHFTRQFLGVFPDSAPTLVEPNPHCQQDLARLPFERHPLAASNTGGKGEFFLSRDWLQSTGASLYRENTEYFDDATVLRHEVDKARIDDLFAGRRFDFVKIDTQGSEVDVLVGGQAVLSQADFILIKVSLIDYNTGGALAEDVFAQMARMGFRCSDVVEFNRMPQLRDNALLQIAVLFERADRLRRPETPTPGARVEETFALAERLRGEGRADDAALLFEHLASEAANPFAALVGLSRSHLAAGRVLEALRALARAKTFSSDLVAMWPLIREQTALGSEAFNAHLAQNEIALAEPYASVMSELMPGGVQMIGAAMGCNLTLDRTDEARRFARMLVAVDPGHVAALTVLADEARAAGEIEAEIRYRTDLAMSPDASIHPLVRLRDFHEAMSLLLCRPLSDADLDVLASLAARVAELAAADLPVDSEWVAWVQHYRALLGALDIEAIRGPTPTPEPDPAPRYLTATGQALDDAGLQALADRLGVQTVFFAAADEKYVDQYGRWYALSVLRHSDVSCLVVIHVIGGGERLAQAVRTVGVHDERLIFVGDDFDVSTVTTRCYDAPPKGLIALPVAHFQSVRFQRLGGLLSALRRPVFVSDIDLLLQRGVSDLLEQWSGADVVFNENVANTAAGSRLTANLLLVNPTDNAALLLRWLRVYLDDRLGRETVTRWIDQVALLLGRHHLLRHAPDAVLGCFDTTSDINNVMFGSYQEHPFRFLSLYHGFDTSSLENDPRVLGAEPNP
ncbi:FkbM family methyltransferase [Caulobacter sp.]|uniref:FkbM family methyltransferase n=1 Tax=Caulobacter sp. TaxID=78 RepID=UPI003BACC91A